MPRDRRGLPLWMQQSLACHLHCSSPKSHSSPLLRPAAQPATALRLTVKMVLTGSQRSMEHSFRWDVLAAPAPHPVGAQQPGGLQDADRHRGAHCTSRWNIVRGKHCRRRWKRCVVPTVNWLSTPLPAASRPSRFPVRAMAAPLDSRKGSVAPLPPGRGGSRVHSQVCAHPRSTSRSVSARLTEPAAQLERDPP